VLRYQQHNPGSGGMQRRQALAFGVLLKVQQQQQQQ
jgi:hypothetical protein